MMKRKISCFSNDRLWALFAALTWGCAMWSRTAFAYYMEEIDISASQLGVINFATSIGSMAGAIILCRIADRRKGHMQFLAFGLFLAGLVQLLISASSSLAAFVVFRLAMGFGLGCVYSLCQAVVRKNSSPERCSANAGMVENGEAVISTMLGPVAIVSLISFMGWRNANRLLALPVFLFALGWWILWKRGAGQQGGEEQGAEKVTFRELLKVHNMRLCVVLSVLTLTTVWIMYTYCPSYWTSLGGLSEFQMSTVMTMAGAVAIGWCFLLPAASDRLGRRIVTSVFAAFCMTVYLILSFWQGSFLAIAVYVIFAGSACTLSMFFMALITAESVRPEYAASAISLVNACGEILGGAVGPLIAGYLAGFFGSRAPMLMAAVCMGTVLVLTRFLQETAPALRRRN